ncbi:SDR family oxidoreductase [Falsirhodobacter algicola]|uniref:SDR family NAD(P)-dependent oxidoreductase n=1 Tax=Falsirhodobacter algicola TaxID=2692330 RepID=A0A8J8SL76_9RHOB|nr:SDR family oxidoreductase [Falsirhodobacter algicola]QUS36116.1 SDR family NAD(P)-dependent oxidoreductase [Falsirhodobacter algicola]
MPTLLSLGHGYSARALAARLLPRGWRVIGTTRDASKPWQPGVERLIWPAPIPDGVTHLLASAAPDAAGDPFLATHAEALAALPLHWAGYLSTTGVYGDHGGGWVDEDTPPAPTTRRGEQRLLAERQWQARMPVHIFRLAGIYGPGRGPFEKVKDGTARRIIKPGQVFSRIHVEDIAQVLDASIHAPAPGIFNVCDDDPAPPQDVIAEAARLLGLPIPPAIPFDEAEMSPMARSFYAESKRVRNDRMKALGVRLRFPDYRAGLADLLASASVSAKQSMPPTDNSAPT